MTHNMAPANAPWFEHLTDSVRALGQAAHEWQLADQTARLLEAGVQFGRRSLHEGRILVHGPATRGYDAKPYTREWHAHAVMDLQKIYMEHRFLTRRRYEHAAMLFASGAARAIAKVRAGEQPTHVLFTLDGDRMPVVGGYKIGDLDPYSGRNALAAAYARLASMDYAAEIAEEIAGREDHEVSERDANDMFEAGAFAEGLPDAAYEYGRLAESALQFVLLDARRAHGEELAARRKAEQQAAAADEQGGAQ